MRDLSQTLSEMINPSDYKENRPVTLNVLQRVIGLLEHYARLSELGRTLMIVPRAEANLFLRKLEMENEVHPDKQTKCIVLSLHSRRNLLFWRAVLLESQHFPLPLEDDRWSRFTEGGADIVLHTDASGIPKEWHHPNYSPTCLGVYVPPTPAKPQAQARAFVLPYAFLMGSDNVGLNCWNSTLLELLPVFAEILLNPESYIGKTIAVYIDNSSTVSIFSRLNPKKIYMAHFVEALNFTLAALKCKVQFKWRRRRSSFPSEISDDLTHCIFKNVRPGTECTRHSLPPPLQKVVTDTTCYWDHTLGSLRAEVKKYLIARIPTLSFSY